MDQKPKLKKQQNFIDQVLELVVLIPHGRVSSYGAIAKYLGTGKSSRMVGWALKHSDLQHIPAHRVVNRMGLLSGKNAFPTPDFMAKRLMEEGVKVENDKVVEFELLFWDPFTEL